MDKKSNCHFLGREDKSLPPSCWKVAAIICVPTIRLTGCFFSATPHQVGYHNKGSGWSKQPTHLCLPTWHLWELQIHITKCLPDISIGQPIRYLELALTKAEFSVPNKSTPPVVPV